MAYKAFEARLASGKFGPKNPKDREAALKKFKDESLEPLRLNVQKRLAHFKENTEALSPLSRAEYAAEFPRFEEFRGDRVVTSKLGLGRKSLDLLLAIDPKSVQPQDQLRYISLQFLLLLKIGEADTVRKNLQEKSIQERLPPEVYNQFLLFASAALGNYELMDDALAKLEARLHDATQVTTNDLNRRRGECLLPLLLTPSMRSSSAVAAALGLETLLTAHPFNRYILSERQHTQALNNLLNTTTLRGILALEAGDTKAARTHFQNALDEADKQSFYFSDRPIAYRYRELLKEQAK
jgi:hypothetical protein